MSLNTIYEKRHYVFESGNKRFRYEFRDNRVLVIFADFRLQIYKLADAIQNNCLEVLEVSMARQYDDGRGDLIINLARDYDKFTVISELEEVFNQFIEQPWQ